MKFGWRKGLRMSQRSLLILSVMLSFNQVEPFSLRDTTPARPFSPAPGIGLPSYVVWGREMPEVPVPCDGRRRMTAGVVDGCIAVAARRREVGEGVGTGL